MEISEEERLKAFSVWLRTGRLPASQNADDIELKFNPWHDPETGRFTFAGTGRYVGGWMRGGVTGGGGGRSGGSGASGSWDAPEPSKSKPPPRAPSSMRGTRRSVGGQMGGGGRFGGSGASGSWDAPDRVSKPKSPRRTQPPQRAVSVAIGATRGTPAADAKWRTITRNGYAYRIDENERTRGVSGTLTLNKRQQRSRTAQARAGKPDRRSSDDGGHYIARQFNGPTEAFNHFAQDRNFNRGRYRALEKLWAEAVEAGDAVFVKITPNYQGTSQRPDRIDVFFIVDGDPSEEPFPNESQEAGNGK